MNIYGFIQYLIKYHDVPYTCTLAISYYKIVYTNCWNLLLFLFIPLIIYDIILIQNINNKPIIEYPKIDMGVKIVYSLLVFTVLSSILFILTGLTMFSQQINVFVFNQKHIFSYKDKLAIAKTLCIWLGVYMFLLVTSVMLIRIYTGKFNASKGTEPTAISAINRIITNTI